MIGQDSAVHRLGSIRLTLGPGRIKILTPVEILSGDENKLICEIEKSNAPVKCDFVDSPLLNSIPHTSAHFSFGDFEILNTNNSIKNIMRDVRIAFNQFIKTPFPSCAYKLFFDYAEPENFAFDHFFESFVSEAAGNPVITESYRSSSQHVILSLWENKITDSITNEQKNLFTNEEQIKLKNHGAFVFQKTEYIHDRRNLIERKIREKELSRLQKESDARKEEYEEAIGLSMYDRYVYLMEDLQNGRIKIGKSRNPERREKTLQSEAPTVELRFAIPISEEAESILHNEYAEFRKRGEWFELTPSQICAVLTKLLAEGDSKRLISDSEWIGRIFIAGNIKCQQKWLEEKIRQENKTNQIGCKF